MLGRAKRIPRALSGKGFWSENDAPGLFEFSGLQLFSVLFLSSLEELSPQEVGTSSGGLGPALGLLTAPEGFIEGLGGIVLPGTALCLTHLCPQPPGSARRTNSPARTATASGVCGTVMGTTTVVTTVTSNAVSGALGAERGQEGGPG